MAVPLVSQYPADIIAECEKAAELPCDIIEWRADNYLSAIEDLNGYLSDKNGYLDMVKILDDINYIAGEKPLIFTVRSKAQGGNVQLTRAQLESIYGLVAETQLVDMIDMELMDESGNTDSEWLKAQIDEVHIHGGRVILSHHDFESMPQPAKLVDIVRNMYTMGADICKVAAMASDRKEAENLLKVSALLTKNNVGPLIMLAMGDAGMASRVAGGRYGSCITFASGEEKSAPGQADTYTMQKWLDSYYGA